MATFTELDGTKWAGTSELYLDPLGDEATRGACSLSIAGDFVRYAWSYEGKDQEGAITLRADGADFADSWHSPEAMKCWPVLAGQGLFQVEGRYGPQAEWRWRIGLSIREPSGELVLQMTNIAPWGEETRAVRMICTRRPAS